MDIYRERAHLLALLSRHYPAHLAYANPVEEGFSLVVCIHFPWGQGSWHLANQDAYDLFGHLEVTRNDWDGHTTDEKYAAIRTAVLSEAVTP